jgi:hypothetical protein
MRTYLAATSLAALLGACGDNDHEAELTALQGTVDELQQRVDELEAARAELTRQRDELAAGVSAAEARLQPRVTLEVPLVYGAAALALATPYPVAGGSDTIAFREVRYWLSNVALRRADGSYAAVPDAYYLIEARPEQPLTNGTEAALTLPPARRESVALAGVPAGTYTGIRFNVGVDGAHNDDLSKPAGELHTLRNMTFDNGWMWFTSYVFTRTRADLDGAGGAAVVSWDNGTNADLREVALAFPAPLAVKTGAAYTVRVRADLAELVADVSPRQHLVIGAGTPADRTLLADGFRDMFKLDAAIATP